MQTKGRIILLKKDEPSVKSVYSKFSQRCEKGTLIWTYFRNDELIFQERSSLGLLVWSEQGWLSETTQYWIRWLNGGTRGISTRKLLDKNPPDMVEWCMPATASHHTWIHAMPPCVILIHQRHNLDFRYFCVLFVAPVCHQFMLVSRRLNKRASDQYWQLVSWVEMNQLGLYLLKIKSLWIWIFMPGRYSLIKSVDEDTISDIQETAT